MAHDDHDRSDDHGRGDHWLDRIMLYGLLALVATVQFSIFVAEIVLTLTLLAWIASLIVRRERPGAPPWFGPLLVYAAISLLATACSLDPVRSLGAAKQMLLFLIVPAVYAIARERRSETVIQVVLTVGAISAIVGVIQFGMLDFRGLGKRPQGTLGHYMTYSGQLMMVVCTATAFLLYRRRDRLWPALIMPALLAALALTYTRNAWVGACAGAGLLLLMKDLRWVGALPVVVAVVFAVAPSSVTERAFSIFDPRDPTSRDRVAMFQAGTDIVRRYPITGVGPNMLREVYPNYRRPTAVEPTPPHLHNVPLQIAAERGLLALAAWGWFVLAAGLGLWRKVRHGERAYLAAAGLGSLAAMLAAGFFEYNFGDSEFLIILLVLLTLPWAARARQPITHGR